MCATRFESRKYKLLFRFDFVLQKNAGRVLVLVIIILIIVITLSALRQFHNLSNASSLNSALQFSLLQLLTLSRFLPVRLLAAYVLLVVIFPSIPSFLQSRVLEGSPYARCNQSS
jgi:hypothetical protein